MSWEWLKSWWEDPKRDMVAGYLAGKADDPAPSVKIKPRQQYFSLTVECLRIVLEREGIKKFFGVLSGRVGFDLNRGPDAITLIISPEDLKGVDKSDLGKIIVQTIPLCEKIPYIGESIDLRLALMSLEMENLLNGVVDVLSSVAKAAGVGYVEQAKAFLAPIEKGIDLLTKQGGTEIGLYKVITEPKTGYYCVARASKERLNLSKCKLSEDWQLIDQSGKVATDVPYFVVSIKAHDNKDNFARIPSIRDAYEKLRTAAVAGEDKNARDAFDRFSRTVTWSDDLLDHDRKPMIEWARTQLSSTFPAKQTSKEAVLRESQARAFPRLEEFQFKGPVS